MTEPSDEPVEPGLQSFDGPAPGAPARGGRRHDGKGRRRGGGRGRAERAMVPDAHFTSYYGRPVVKASPWEIDIPAYLFFGGLAAGSSLLGAGAQLTGRDGLRRTSRIAAFSGISMSFGALVHDLGRPKKFINMLRVVKPTSPMSVGTWILVAYGPLAGLVGAAEISTLLPSAIRALGPLRMLRWVAGPAGLAAAFVAPPVAAYTAVLLSDTATPSWHEAWRELPFVFAGSAAAASGGFALAVATGDVMPARRLALGGAALELTAAHKMEGSMGLAAEPLHEGRPGQAMKASKGLTVAGAALVAAPGPRLVFRLGGALLVAGSFCTRFGIFYAGQASARDPKYTMVPQRERLDRDGPSRG